MEIDDFESSPKIPGEIIYDKTKFSSPPARESGESKPGMVYDRTVFQRDPSSERKAEEAGSAFAQSMKADAYEMIFIPRQTDEIYDATDSGEARLRRHEAASYIGEEIAKAAETQTFLKTLEHYGEFLESVSDEIEPNTMEQIRSLLKEGRDAMPEGRKDFLKKVSDFCKSVSYGEY